MMSTPANDLDARIEEALVGEPLRPVPFGLRRRIDTRIRIAAVAQRERRHLRNHLVFGALLVLGMFAGCGFVFVAVDLDEWLAWSMPGGMGYFDYLVLSLSMAWSAWLGTVVAWSAAAVFAVAVLAAVSLRRLRHVRN